MSLSVIHVLTPVLGLDTLPLLLGIAIYVPFWPGRYLTPATKVTPATHASEAPVNAQEAGVVPPPQSDSATTVADAPVTREK